MRRFGWRCARTCVCVCLLARLCDSSCFRLPIFTRQPPSPRPFSPCMADDLTAEERVQGQVGLRRVLDAVSASGKLVVGHNMGLDMVHLAVSFFGIRSHTLGEYKVWGFFQPSRILLVSSLGDPLLREGASRSGLCQPPFLIVHLLHTPTLSPPLLPWVGAYGGATAGNDRYQAVGKE